MIDLGLTILAAVVVVPLVVFTLEVLASLCPRRKRNDHVTGPRPRAAVLIPAHDEERGIAETLRSVFPALGADDRVLVVADNCTDTTADVARALGAEVVERHDPERRGKGYALDFGVAHLAETGPPDVLVVVDADCTITPESIDRLARTVGETGRPAQSSNLAEDDPDPTPLQSVSALSFRFKNLVRPRGTEMLGWPCHLMGTGMAVPWDVAVGTSFGGDNLVEDMQLGVDLAIAGRPGVFEPDALVTSPLPKRDTAFVSQRTRWETGHVRTAIANVPRLLWAAVRRLRLAPLGLALDLCVPPLSLLVLVWSLATLAAGIGWWCGAAVWPAVVLLAGGGSLVFSILLGWFVHCRKQVPWTTFARIPWFVLRKLPIYVRLLTRRRTGWVRTERDEATPLVESTGNTVSNEESP